MSTFGERMNEMRGWSSARATVDFDVTVDRMPGIVRQAVASVPGLGISELGPDAGTLFRKTTLAYRAGSIALTFEPQGSRTRVIAVTRSSMPLVGTDYGRGDKDLAALFETMRAAVIGVKPGPLSPTPSLALQRLAIGRVRVFGLVFVIVGAIGCVLAIALLVAPGGRGAVIGSLQLLLWVLMTGVGVRRLLVARRRLAAFEAANGPHAGEQPSGPRGRP
ncbi:hypothetical protein ACI2IX_12940 [Leifsonia aquatica]|uniref:hypothetical protein n=1 Tax=Leifsonia aquatica TaxID=144185 RepID=UPI00384D6D48